MSKEATVNPIITRTCTIHYDMDTAKHPDILLRLHIRQLIKDYQNQFEYESYMMRVLVDETTPNMPSYGELTMGQKIDEEIKP